MTNISDAFSTIKDRLANPLFFSFTVSWLVVNWQIPVALIWADSNELRIAGYNTIFDFVKEIASQPGSTSWPIKIALIYTFIFPLIRNGINAFNAMMAKQNDDWYFWISKESKISTASYLKLRQSYYQRSVDLEKTIQNESKAIAQLSQTQTELLKSQNENIKLQDESAAHQTFLRLLYDSTFLNGKWKYKTMDANGVTKESIVIFENSKLSIHASFGEESLIANISNFRLDTRNGIVSFVKEFQKNGKITSVGSNELRLEGTDKMHGTENREVRVDYTRMALDLEPKDGGKAKNT
jgi:hypothetical protein